MNSRDRYPQTACSRLRRSTAFGEANRHGKKPRPVRKLPLVVVSPGDRDDPVALQLEIQDGMITRRQLDELGVSRADIVRMLRRRDLVGVAPGVYVDHTGKLSWIQRAWCEVMRLWPAALSHETAWRQTPVVHVAVDLDRRVKAPRGVVVHRRAGLDGLITWHHSPPRMKIEHAALEAAAVAPGTVQMAATLSEVVQRRLTSYRAILGALEQRPKLAQRRALRLPLADLSNRTNSVLEHAYLVEVERPHGLPTAERQLVSRVGGRRAERDVVYLLYGLIVELDGRAFHDTATARDRDLQRDLDAAVHESARTVRLG